MAESVPTNVHAIRGAIRRLAEGDREAKRRRKKKKERRSDDGEGSCEEEFCVLLVMQMQIVTSYTRCSVPSSVCKSRYAISRFAPYVSRDTDHTWCLPKKDARIVRPLSNNVG